MNFRIWTILLLLPFGSTLKAQQSMTDPVFRHDRFFAIGTTPLSTAEINTVSLEWGYALSNKVQFMAAPQMFIANYERFSSVSNRFGSFYGGFAGIRYFFRGIPRHGWSYFNSGELHFNMQSFNSLVFLPTDRFILSPALGTGFGRFSENGFYFLFNFKFGTEFFIRSQASGEVFSSLRLSAGIRL